MKKKSLLAGLFVVLAMLASVVLAEYIYIISDNSENESQSAVSEGSVLRSGVNSAAIVPSHVIEGRFRTWEYSEGIGIDPTLGCGTYIFLR
jgi:hypothetical protein